jgi:hypothetical protein
MVREKTSVNTAQGRAEKKAVSLVQLGRNPCLVIQIAAQLLKVLRHCPKTEHEFTLRSTSLPHIYYVVY